MDNQTGGNARYFAFISHKNTDKKFALKLQKFIESYNLPAEIRRKTNSPKRLTPLCSYEVDFSSQPLMDEMQDKLQKSKYLILLCSEALIKNGTKYVNHEIRTFIECKKAEGCDPLTRIIPIIVDGSFGDPEHNCCPEALFELGDNCPIALDRKSYKNDRELFLHAIAGMLDIDYAVLENRDKKRQRQKKLRLGIILLFLLASCIAVGEYYIPREYHYLDFVMKNGLPEGISPLSRSEYSSMPGHYVITVQKHRIRSLEYVNAFGKRIAHSETNIATGGRPSAYLFDYTASGLHSVTYENKEGDPYFVLQYSSNSLLSADFRDPALTGDAYFLGLGCESDPSMILADYNISSHSDISRYVYEYSDEGYVTKITFCSDSNGRLAHDNSVYGYEYVLDEKGRITETYFLDAEGGRRLNSGGVYCRQFVYDENDHFVEWKNLGFDGSPVPDANGILHQRMEYDNRVLVGIAFFDQDENPMRVASYGGAFQRYTYNENGCRVRSDILDINGNLITDYAYCSVSFTYDQNGFPETRTYLNADGVPTEDPDDLYAAVKYLNDESGNPTEITFYDVSGQLTENAYGYAKVLTTYNDRGSIVKEEYFTADGSYADYRGYGYSICCHTYDSMNRETSISYYDGDGGRVNISGPSFSYVYHKAETTYGFGAFTEITTAYYDADGNLVNTKSEALGELNAKEVMVFQNGRITSAEYYTADGAQYGTRLEVKTEKNAQAEDIEIVSYYDSDSVLLQEIVTQYRINGTEAKKTHTLYRNGGNVERRVEYLYRTNGMYQETHDIYYNDEGSVAEEYSYTYNEMGLEASVVIITPDDPSVYSTEFSFTYDAAGAKTQQIMLLRSEDGVPTAVSENWYNSDGTTKASETVYFVNGKKTTGSYTEYINELAVLRESLEYDENGNRRISDRRVYTYDAKGNPTATESTYYRDSGSVEFTVLTEYYADGTKTNFFTVCDDEGNIVDTFQAKYDADGNEIE